MIVDNIVLMSDYDSLELSVVAVLPDCEPVASVQFVHGMCGCKERFIPVMSYLAGHGMACYAADHRGHGASVKSDSDLGYMYDGGWNALVADMRKTTEYVRKNNPDIPLVIVGHSMGSLVARLFLKRGDLLCDGMILCGSPSRNPMAFIGRILTSVMCLWNKGRIRPTLMQDITSFMYNRHFRSEGPRAWTCSDAELRKSFSNNPRCNFYFTANGLYNLLCMMRETYSPQGWNVSDSALPLLFLSGEDDPCMIDKARLEESAGLMRSVGYDDVTVVTYPNMRHEVLNEIGKEQVWNDVLDFVRSVRVLHR